jgi:hypothetical protein
MTRRLLLRALSLSLLVLTGCVWGKLPKDFPPAQQAAGARVTFFLKGSSTAWRGELFAIDDEYAYVLESGVLLYRVRWEKMSSIELDDAKGEYPVPFPPESEGRRLFAAVSRFPQGLSGPLLAQVLQRLEQPRLEERP